MPVLAVLLLGPAPASAGSGGYRDGELLVKFRAAASERSQADLHRRNGAALLKAFRGLRLDHVRLPGGLDVREAVRLYQRDPGVEYAEPNYELKLTRVPNDPQFAGQWALHNTGASGTPDADIDAPEAWDLTTGSSQVVIAVLDTGVDYAHRDLAANMWRNPGEVAGNGVDDDGNGYVDDVHGIDTYYHDSDPDDVYVHGTHVAGIIGAVGNNRTGVAGINWNVRMMAVKIFSDAGLTWVSHVVEALEYVRMMKGRGVNIVATSNSWGGFNYEQAIADAIERQREILFVAAAGNESRDNDEFPFYPANFDLPSVVSVGATTAWDALAGFSSWGPHSVHLGAPGEGILNTVPGGGYGQLSGTSMATPHVTGVVALLAAQDPTRDWRSLRNLVLAGGDDVGALAGRTVTGKRLNAFGALACSGRPLFAVRTFPARPAVGGSYPICALSTVCAAAAGPVTVASPAGSLVLGDDGVGADPAAGDGLFCGTWSPSATSETLVFASPAGTSAVTVSIPPVSVATTLLPPATIGRPYSASLAAADGFLPYAWSIVAGALPPGLGLDPATGRIEGTPTADGYFDFSVRLLDGSQAAAGASLFLRVNPCKWSAVYGDYSAEFANGVAVAPDGSVYVAGEYLEDGHDFHLVKYAPDGTVLWSRTYGGATGETARAVAVDGTGNVYVTGSVLNGSQRDVLTVKYSASGALLWAKTYGGTGDEDGYGVAADAAGNVYLAGTAYNSKTYFNFLTVKYTPAGKLAWAKTYSHTAGHLADVARAVAVDAAGNVAVTGETHNGYDNDRLTVKYGPTGTLLWSRVRASGADDLGRGIAVDAAGNVYAGGTTAGTYEVVKHSPSGAVLHNFGWGWGDAAGLGLDAAGNVYVTGSGYTERFGGVDYLTVKFDSGGNVVWSRTHDGGGTSDYAAGIAVTPAGDVYVTGYGPVPYDPFYTDFNFQTVRY